MKILSIKTLWPEDKDFKLERRVGDEYIFLHLLTDLYVVRGGKREKLPAGCCYCFAPGDSHRIEAPKGGLLHDWAHFSNDFEKIAEKYGFCPSTVYTPGDDSFVTELMRAAELEYMNGGEFSGDICEMKICELVAKLVRATHRPENTNISPALYAAFSEARTQIHMDYRSKWDIERMAELVHLSPSRFFTLYKAVFGISPKSDLVAVRMEHAKMLLADGRVSVKDAAEMTGYTNVYHFIRSFKEHTGKTPGKYKNN